MDNPATEVLEQELIDLLGLKNDPGMTYEDYFDELKEAAIAAQMNQSTYTSDQAQLIREELVRVREKFKKDPKVKSTNFKFKSKTQKVNEDKKINKDNVSSINFPKLTGKISNVKIKKTNLLPQSQQEEVKEEKKYKKEKVDKPKKSNELIKILNNINKKLNSILSTLSSQAALDTRNAERQRRDRESERRGRQESSLEGLGSGIKSIAKVGKTMLAPLENIWDKIVRFFTFVLLGKAFFAFMKWMSDPENKKKFDTIVKFLSKHWLLIAGAYILFGTSLGGLVRFIIKSVIRLSAAMLKVIPRLLSVIARSKMGRLGLAATALLTAGAIVPKLFPKTVDEQERNISERGGTTQEKIQQLQSQKDKLNFFEKLQGKGAEIDEQIYKLQSGETKSYGFYNGGIIPSFANGGLLNLRSGIPVTGAKGDDTLIAAKTGEAVLTKDDQKDIYQKYGLNIPQYLNNRKPSVINSKNIKPKVGGGYFNGGIVQGFSNGGVVNKPISLLDLGRQISGNPNHKFDPTLQKSIPLLYQILQSGRFKEKGWGNKAFMDQLTARLLVESKNFSRAREMYEDVPGRPDPTNKPGYNYFGIKYGNRLKDLGNTGFDDGYNFRGRGAIQLTGRNHYERFNEWLKSNGHKGIDVVKNPDLLATDPKIQALSTLYYLEDREKTFKVNFADMANEGDSTRFTYNINGGYNHLTETQDNLRRIQGLPGGVNYGQGFLPRQPRTPGRTPGRTPQQGFNPFSMAGSAIRRLLPGFSATAGTGNPSFRRGEPGVDEFAGVRNRTIQVATPRPRPPKRWGIDPRGWFGMRGGGIVGRDTDNAQNRSLKMAGSLIRVAPIDTMPDRPMTGFRDLAESYRLNKSFGRSGVQGLKGGGEVSKGPTIEDIMMQAHNTTVRIETAAGPEGSGSGVLVRNDKGQYTVLTAGHVLGGTALGEDYVVVTPDGKRHTIKKTESNARGMGGDTDMGTLSFNSKENYAVARPGDPTKVKPGDTTYVGGFPYNPLTSQQDEALRFTKGQSMNYSLSSDEKLKQGYTMAYSNATFPGMSGGFVYNSAGELIGIHGSGGFKGVQEGSRAIPISHYTSGFGSTSDKPVLKTPSSFNIPSGLIKKQENTLTEYNQMDNPYLSDKGSLLNYANSWLLGTDKKIKERMVQPFKAGGFIREDTGLPIAGGTADRVLTALSPGEYVLPKATVNAFGGRGYFDTITALTDVNSEPAKMGINPKNIASEIKPYETGNAGKPEFIKLPPINSGNNNSQSPPQMGASKEVFFSPICEVDHAQSERQRILDVLGVITN